MQRLPDFCIELQRLINSKSKTTKTLKMTETINNPSRDMWNARYEAENYAYGKDPNVFFADWIAKVLPGTILMPADGEGRNGVFAAQLGWQVTSFDMSEEGKRKALELAEERDTAIDYIVGDLKQLQFEEWSFDAIGLIYAHFTADEKSMLHKKLDHYLKPGGIIIFEAFSKQHLRFNAINPNVGGPTDLGMLFSMEEIIADFYNYDILLIEEVVVRLDEGKYHIGKGSVIRFVGRKRI